MFIYKWWHEYISLYLKSFSFLLNDSFFNFCKQNLYQWFFEKISSAASFVKKTEK